ncbi:hypothetical protein CRG98_002518 [Punica granatum]|uniref:Uncharacterized protein n=1 Tax=Punica granatum TaxID=22663 RepID=A0A2I0L8J1_PUNGR|nr:hypothetical protein CRG98_002518 [Punica granatum]
MFIMEPPWPWGLIRCRDSSEGWCSLVSSRERASWNHRGLWARIRCVPLGVLCFSATTKLSKFIHLCPFVFLTIAMRVVNFIMRTFWFILNFAASFFYKEPVQPASQMRARKLPLHTCAVSILSSTHRVYTRAQEYNGLSGLLFRKSARLTTSVDPYAREIKNWCLSILTCVDDQILAVECGIEKNFPASTFVFDRVDELVRAMETFPETAEQMVSRLLSLIHKVPFLNLASSHITSRLDCWLSKWGWDTAAREKDIPMDSRSADANEGIVSDKYCPGSAHDKEAGKELFPSVEPLLIKPKTSDNCANISPKGTYKEVLLDEGNTEDHKVELIKEGDDGEQITLLEDASSKEEGKEEEQEKVVSLTTEEGSTKDDQILDLFESGWHMKKPV